MLNLLGIIKIDHPKRLYQVLKSCFIKGFGEQIGYVLISMNIFNFNQFLFSIVSNKMMSHCNVFGTGVLNRVFS